MKILYSHHGIKGKCGWGRTFYMARGLADLGHEVTLFTINPKISLFRIHTIVYQGVTIKILPDFSSKKMKSSGFAIWSTIIGIIYSVFHKFDMSVADCGHRFTALPCKINRMIYKSFYISEWWDFFGRGGYIDKKNKLFKFLYGKIECYNELYDKRNADAVVVLSSFMKKRAIENGIVPNKIFIIPGGSIANYIDPLYPTEKSDDNKRINIAYIGISNHELDIIMPFIEALKYDEIKQHFKLILYGNPISAEKWDRFGLDDIAEHRGWIDYTKDISTLHDVDIFLQLLDNNNISKAGWPNKLGDYLSFGKPVILSPYGDVANFVKGQNGFFLVSYEKESIANMLNKIKNMSTKKFQKMGISNYQLACNISWKNRAKDMISIFDKLKNPATKI